MLAKINMKFNYIDIHSHLNLDPLVKDQKQVLSKMFEQGVATITVGVDYETSIEAIRLANENHNFYACVGLHPNDHFNKEFDKQKYLELAKNDCVVAIGETGLDYFRDQSDENKENQKNIFRKHIEISIELGKPLMIHARPSRGTQDAYIDAIDILEEFKLKNENHNLLANFHFFVGDLETANRIVSNGWSMSFDGPITFSSDYDDIIKNIPLRNIMAETDAPFAAPDPYRGKICEPWMVTLVYDQIARIREEDVEHVRLQINQNAVSFFGLV